MGGNLFNLQPVKDKLRINILGHAQPAPPSMYWFKARIIIFHLAGQVSHGDSMRDPQLDLGGQLHFNDESGRGLPSGSIRRCDCFTLRPVSKVSGKPPPAAGDRAPYSPDRCQRHQQARRQEDYYHLLYDRTYGVRSVVLRLTNTYGPRQQVRSNRQGFIGIIIRQALLGDPLKVFGSGRATARFQLCR